MFFKLIEELLFGVDQRFCIDTYIIILGGNSLKKIRGFN